MAKLLIVTDMQSGMLDTSKMTPEMRMATEKLIDNVSDRIASAMENGERVVFVEHAGAMHAGEFGKTLPVLLRGVPDPIVLEKRSVGIFGEDTVNQQYRARSLEYFRSLSEPIDVSSIVGVNTGDCVLGVAQDLVDESIGKNVQILAGYTLRLLNPHVAYRFQADNDLTFPLSGHGLWYKEEIMKFMPKYHQSGVDLIRELENPDHMLTI